MKNLLIVLSGPSGVGKGTIVKRLIEKGGYALSISCTTREPRRGEKDGREYFFITKEKFLKMIGGGGFLEYSNHFENYYGTPKEFVEERLKTCNVLLEIDVDGGLQVKKSYPQALLIMIAPPNKEELKRRLLGRGSESAEKIEKRLSRMEYELAQSEKYDYTVINDDLNAAVAQIENIIKRKKEQIYD